MITDGFISYVKEVVKVTEVVPQKHQDVVRLEYFVTARSLVRGLVLEHKVLVVDLREAQRTQVLLRPSTIDFITVGDVIDIYP